MRPVNCKLCANCACTSNPFKNTGLYSILIEWMSPFDSLNWIIVGQGHFALAVGAGVGCSDIYL